MPNDIPTIINGGPHHRSTVSNMTTSDFPDVLGNDELAANLIKCATYVKIGETHHPLLRQTINDLTYFVTGKQVLLSTAAVPPISNHSPASSVLAKKSVTQLASGMMTKLGLQQQDDTSSVGVGSVSGRSEAQKSASSMKHAESARMDVQRTLGSTSSSTANSTSRLVDKTTSKKPPFQRPTNTASSLIANGWIEQQRRSKLRVVWKEVLASLVEGRKPGEETTLWIQREYYSHSTNKMELEALHQIPIKLIRNISYQDYTTDHRFLIKVHNMHEDFIFRCEKSEEAAQNWVITIRSVLDIINNQKRASNSDNTIPIRAALEKAHQQQERERHTSNESSAPITDEKKIPASGPGSATYTTMQHPPQPHQSTATVQNTPPVAPSISSNPQATTLNTNQPPNTSIPHMSITEMRAIAHGAGIQTHGMERGELERIVQQISNSVQMTLAGGGGGVSPPPPAAPHFATAQPQKTPPMPNRPIVDPSLQRSTSAEEEMARQQKLDRQQQIEEAARRRKLAEDAARNKAAAEAQQAYVRQQQEAIEKQKRAEEERKRLEAERLRRDEEEHQRRVAEQQAAEQRRRVEEQQRQQQEQWKQQQENWQKQQLEEEQRRRADEVRLAEEKRRQEEAYRAQHQQWQQQQQVNGVPPNQWQQPHPSVPPPFGQKPPPPQYGPGGAQGPPHHPGQPQHHPGNSQVDQKYAKMATQVGDAGQQRSLQVIKHGILVEWALQPPAMQILRPIEILITSVHLVFPPKYGVPGHEHFTKWSIVTLPEVMSGTQPDDEKLSKAVKKLRFVLHPDKLPREFTEEQIFMCRMIWDIVSDAFEDHKKREEELAWMR
jgi:hypothetical protein